MKYFFTIFILLLSLPLALSLEAFPGAEGFGAQSYGGSGRHLSTPSTTVYKVTSLSDSGDGSLRECAQASGPRVCVFETSGVINLANDIVIDEPYLTIAGQTAPSPGITLVGGGIIIQDSHVVLQHIAVRVGDEQNGPSCGRRDSIRVETADGQSNVVEYIIIDHVSATWGVDETVDFEDEDNGKITISNSIIAQGLSESCHPEIEHSKGAMVGINVKDVSFVKNLFAHNNNRNPLIQSEAEVINNVIYNWKSSGLRFSRKGLTGPNQDKFGGPIIATAIGNVFIDGLDTNSGKNPIEFRENPANTFANENPAVSRVYLLDNVKHGGSSSDWSLVSYYTTVGEDRLKATSPDLLSSNSYLPSSEVLDKVLPSVGARPLDRMAIDAQIVDDVSNAVLGSPTGRIINCVSDDGSDRCDSNAGGWPSLSENIRSLSLPIQYNQVMPSGYTALEEWLHSYSLALEVEESCVDLDNDGYGISGHNFCQHADLDCDDSSNSINPGALESCADGVDNDCNGEIDEGCSSSSLCIIGETRSCNSGLLGICGEGSQTCLSGSTADFYVSEDFEDANYQFMEQSCEKKGTCNTDSVEVVDDYVREGQTSLRFTLKHTDPFIQGGYRVEFKDESTLIIDEEYWIAFSTLIPPSWQEVPDIGSVIYQTHRNVDQPGSSPMKGIRVKGPNYVLTEEIDSAQAVTVWSEPYEKGVWTDWVMHVKWSPTDNGFFHLYKDGNLVYTENKRNMALGSSLGPYQKFGIYGGVREDVPERTLYYDRFRYASGQGANYDAVASDTPSDSLWSSCNGLYSATTEVCDDNLDNDCDGEVDEECSSTHKADFNGDGAVDLSDFVLLLTYNPLYDLNNDGVVDIMDIAFFGFFFG